LKKEGKHLIAALPSTNESTQRKREMEKRWARGSVECRGGRQTERKRGDWGVITTFKAISQRKKRGNIRRANDRGKTPAQVLGQEDLYGDRGAAFLEEIREILRMKENLSYEE